MDIEEIARIIHDSANQVHNELGPGLPVAVYRQCLVYELRKRQLQVDCGISLHVLYDAHKIDTGLKADLLVENCILVENVFEEQLLPSHEAQLLNYLKLKDCKLGFLINWNVKYMKDGIKRVVYRSKEPAGGRGKSGD